MIEVIDSPIRYTLPLFDETVACYRFRGNANDSSGNGYNLTVSLIADRNYVEGKTEPGTTACHYPLTTTWYHVKWNDTVFNFGSTDFSLEFWIKDNASGNAEVVDRGNGSTSGWQVMSNSDGTYALELATQVITTNRSYKKNEWHYVVFTVDSGNEAKIYVDGRLDKTQSVTTFTDSTFHMYVGRVNFDGWIDEYLIHKNKVMTLAEVQDRYAGRKDLRTFSLDSDGNPPYLQKYNTPVSKIEFADTVSNVLSNGIRAEWSVQDSGTYSTAYTGNVPFVKFYHGLSMPETLVGYDSNPQWKTNYTGYFKPPIDGVYSFYLAGEGRLSYTIEHENTTKTGSSIDKTFADTGYSFATATMRADSAYYFDFGYEYNKGQESGFIVLWDSDSASVTPEKILLSAGVCDPAGDAGNDYIHSAPGFVTISHYNNPQYSMNTDGISSFKFNVPFIATGEGYGNKGFAYDSSTGYYYNIDDTDIKLKEYRMIRYSEGYKKDADADELIVKFTGQITNISPNYSNSGDRLEITCSDFTLFTKDGLNVNSPTPIDYWQAEYISENPGRVNGLTKPQAFDGWEAHKAYEVLLTESYIDPYSMYQKKEHINYNNFATTGGFLIEPINSSVQSYFPINKKYGIEPIGEIGDDNTDDQYAKKADTGEFYQDIINEFFKSWFYKWGFTRHGYPYLRRVQVPSGYINSTDLNYGGSWSSGINVSAFKGDYQTTASDYADTNYVNLDITGSLDVEATSGNTAGKGYTLTNASLSDYGVLSGRIRLYPVQGFYLRGELRFYCTSDSTTTINATTWPLLGNTNFYNTEWRDFEFEVDDPAFGRAKSIGLRLTAVSDAGPGESDDSLIIAQGQNLYYNNVSTGEYTPGDIFTATVTGKKFALLVGKGTACGSADTASQGTFRYKLYKDNTVFVNSSVNPYDSENGFYYDGINEEGINKSYVSIANGLPYDTYNLRVESLSDNYETRIEAVLEFEEDYEVPISTLYTEKSINKLKVEKDTKDHRNDCVVLGRRTGTLFQVNEDGEEIIINPNNETKIYVQSAVRDLNSIYDITANNYVGRPRTTIIVDPSILNVEQADFIAFNFIKEYGSPEKKAGTTIQGNPMLEVDDCITIAENYKQGIKDSDYLWVTETKSSLGELYTTNIETTPIKPVDSYWERPTINIDSYGGNYIWNLQVKNRGIWGTVTGRDMAVGDTGLSITKPISQDVFNNAIPTFGYMRIGRELMQYSSVAFDGTDKIYFDAITRGLGEEGVAYKHYKGDQIAIGYNPYSFKQSAPTVSFDLLADADVAINIKHYPYFAISGQEKVVSIDNKVDSLTDVENEVLDFPNYEFFPAGHYEFVWGGWDRRGRHNNLMIPDDGDFEGSNFYANESYKLPYKSEDAGSYTQKTKEYDTGFGMFFPEIKVIPGTVQTPFTYTTIVQSDTSYLLDSAGDNSTIKTVMNDAGVVDLIFSTSDMYCFDPTAEVKTPEGYIRHYSYTDATLGRTPGGLNPDTGTQTTNFPTANPSGFTYSSVPAVIFNEANVNTKTGASRGFIWKIVDSSLATDADINRYYLPTFTFKIVQLAWAQMNEIEPREIRHYYDVTQGEIGKYNNINIIVFGKEYYFNPYAVLEKENKTFFMSPEKNLLDDFRQHNKKSENADAPMAVSNYTIFLDNMYDPSGRKPKQRNKYIENREPKLGKEHFIFNFSADPGSKTETYCLWYLQKMLSSPIPFYFTGTEVNRGFYEFGLHKDQHSYWSYRDAGLAVGQYRTLHFEKNEAWESTLAPVSSLENQNIYKYNGATMTADYWWGVNKMNYVTWMDENVVRELVYTDYNNYYFDIEWYWQRHNYFNSLGFIYPLAWAYFRRSDFGNV